MTQRKAGGCPAYYEEEAEKVHQPVRTFFERQVSTQAHFEVKVGPAAEQIDAVATQVLARTKVPVLLMR
ncbi:MAG: hypothetical protein ACKOJ7_05385 [Betaproteobacteria bacterium]